MIPNDKVLIKVLTWLAMISPVLLPFKLKTAEDTISYNHSKS